MRVKQRTMQTLMHLYLLLSLLGVRLSGCTVFYATDGEQTLAGTNKSHTNLATCIAVYPADTLHHGRIYLGYRVADGFQNVGGMNEYGLWYDGASLPERGDITNVYGKPRVKGELCEFVLETCTTVAEVRETYATYFTPHWQGHVMWGDAQGECVIIEYGETDVVFIDQDRSFQVMTNFYLQDTENRAWKRDYRYEAATTLLENADNNYSHSRCRSVLMETCQVGIPPTVYSAIYDLRAREIRLYNFQAFDEAAILKMDTLLTEGKRLIDMPGLFSGLKLGAPENAATIPAEGGELVWLGDAQGYQVLVAEDPEFEEAFIFTESTVDWNSGPVWALAILLLPLGYGYPQRRWRIIVLSGILLLGTLTGCLNPIFSPYEVSRFEHRTQVFGLEPGRVYFWKVQRQIEPGITGESKTSIFWTESDSEQVGNG